MQSADQHALARGLGFWQATAINITQVVGSGVFATIPYILGILPGAYAILAWLVAGVLILCDSLIWGELGAALPSAGGSYHFLLESYGRSKWGRLMSFLFVWQILISGPLEVGSGLVAAAQFSRALSKDFEKFDDAHTWRAKIKIAGEEIKPGESTEGDAKYLELVFAPSRLVGVALGLFILLLLYRRVTTLGQLSIVFLVGILALIFWVIIEGALHFDAKLAFDTALKSGEQPAHFGIALGAAMALAIYSYLGYYNVCYLGGEVQNPVRTIPRSILFSALTVIVLFTLIHLSITGFMPWREAMKSTDNLTADFMSRIHGQWAAQLVTVCLIGSCFASCFSGALGYSRVPYAAAREGHFFPWFGEVHEQHRIPHRSLVLVGVLMLFWSFFSLDAIITALIATRILEQFVAQAFAVVLLRKQGRTLPWRMWLYPLPCVIAVVGWLYVYFSTGLLFIAMGACTLVAGLIVFLIWARRQGVWPYSFRSS